jgi:lipopolysaccharide transport system ATP-binding protein
VTDTIMRVEHVGKSYRIGSTRDAYQTLRDRIAHLATAPLQRLRHPEAMAHRLETIWALRDVSFEVGEGEVLGVIGRNGAGKSTLLKLLSGITPPTEGRIALRGRVGSLLEVGTGFHPELSGRENVYLNGAILGMRRSEIDRKFDEIVAFADVERFIDTPVKRYSSGMYVRLAFSVAAHLEPEILLVDEVLAVGDIGFQKKCLGKMDEVSRDGRTVLFVSHNMSVIGALCPQCLWLEHGLLAATGPTSEVVDAYERSVVGKAVAGDGRVTRAIALESGPHVEWLEVRDEQGCVRSDYSYGDYVTLAVKLVGDVPPSGYLEWGLRSEAGHRVSSGGTFLDEGGMPLAGGQSIACRIGPLPLALGGYVFSLKLGVLPGQVIDHWEDAVFLRIVQCDPMGGGVQFDSRRGDVYIPASYAYAQESEGVGSCSTD